MVKLTPWIGPCINIKNDKESFIDLISDSSMKDAFEDKILVGRFGLV